MRRWLALLGVTCALSGALVFSQTGAAVALSAPPLPVPAPPGAVGAVADTGTLTVGGSEVVGLGLAGYGAFQGTCYLLGVITFDLHRGADCANTTPKQLFNLAFGSHGDDRATGNWAPGTVSRLGTAAGNGFCAGVNVASPDGHCSTWFTWNIDQRHLGYHNGTFRIRWNCAGGGNFEDLYISNTQSFNAATTNEAISDSSAKAQCPGTAYSSALGVPVWGGITSVQIDAGTCAGSPCPDGTLESNVQVWNSWQVWTINPAQAWSDTWTETCRVGSNTQTFSATVHYTPSPNGTSPDPNLPNCWDVMPGSHREVIKVIGGRDSASTPEVNVTIPTFTPGATTSYPLCTTKAPASGCFLDLQKAGKSCFANGVYCAGWQQNITRWDMTCEWGPYEVAVSECQLAYDNTFDTQTQPQPDPDPTPAPTNPPEPCNTDCTTPEIPPDPGPTDPQTSCISAAFSWNPVDWVYVPVKCALKWAFVPPDAPGFGDISNPMPTGWVPSFPSLSDGSCGTVTMPSLRFPIIGNTAPKALFNTCATPWSTVRGFTYYGTLAVGLIGLGNRAFRAVMKSLGMEVDTAGGGGGEDE